MTAITERQTAHQGGGGVLVGRNSRTQRYGGNAYAPHMKVDFGPEAFEHWVAAFESAANDALAPVDAEKAIRVARHMAQSFRAGLFPFSDKEGKPSRKP